MPDNSLDRRAIIARRRKCPMCKSPVNGRSDKKFCSVKCKTVYHQKLRQVTKSAAKRIDKILHRNRSILLEILGKYGRQTKIKQLDLEERKFNFNHFTHIRTNKAGKTYYYVYDMAWMTFSDDEVLIVRKAY